MQDELEIQALVLEIHDEGGYEARSSDYRTGIAELVIEEGKKILAQLR